jgi:anhydro-N-acetylmuramic acid kinase
MLLPAPPSGLFIGLMSGTSMDGVDGVLARFDPAPCTAPTADNAPAPACAPAPALSCATLAHAHQPFPPELREQFMALQQPGENEIEREALAANQLAHLYAACVRQLLEQSGVPAAQVRAIGAHGQTIRHRPELGLTRQSQNPALLAELCAIDVIADFRSRDVAAGGQGAPLVPAFHHAIFARPGETRALVNIGGISNISVLHADGRIDGCDTGPGNVLMDGWIGRERGLRIDENGDWAASGKINAPLLASLMAEPFLAQPLPKSTGRDLFHMTWLAQHLAQQPPLASADVQATLCAFTAHSIAQMLLRCTDRLSTLYVCGGGAFNQHLLQQLALALPTVGIASSAQVGVAPDQVEALAFAWLAQRHLQGQCANLPMVTGARGLRILGACYRA